MKSHHTDVFTQLSQFLLILDNIECQRYQLVRSIDILDMAEDYRFIPAKVFDNAALLDSSPEYVARLEGLPPRLRDAWLYGKWDVFEGQFFPEFDPERHVCQPPPPSRGRRYFIAFDYGFDMLAALLIAVEGETLFVESEFCRSGLTLSEAAQRVAELSDGRAEYAVASPDLWNRRQDSGRSGFEVMQANPSMPPMTPADDRRVAGWRMLREFLCIPDGGEPLLKISPRCTELIRCLPALLCDSDRPEDAAGEPHSVTHAPEALRYAVMSRRAALPSQAPADFSFSKRRHDYY